MAKEPKVTTMPPSERREWKTLINTRKNTMLDALSSQVGIGVDAIITQMRAEQNVELTEKQLDNLIDNLDTQIKDEINKHLATQRRQIEIEIDECCDSFDEREREMKQRHKAEWEELLKEKKEKEQGLRTKLKSAEEDIARTFTGELLAKKLEYTRQRNIVHEIEMKITAQADAQVSLIRNKRNQLINLITDAANRATEKLMMVTSSEEAKQLLELVPTVQEAIESIRSAEGLNNMFRRLTQPLLSGTVAPVPQSAPVEIKPDNVIDGEIIDDDIVDVEIPSTVDDIVAKPFNEHARRRDHDSVYT